MNGFPAKKLGIAIFGLAFVLVGIVGAVNAQKGFVQVANKGGTPIKTPWYKSWKEEPDDYYMLKRTPYRIVVKYGTVSDSKVETLNEGLSEQLKTSEYNAYYEVTNNRIVMDLRYAVKAVEGKMEDGEYVETPIKVSKREKAWANNFREYFGLSSVSANFYRIKTNWLVVGGISIGVVIAIVASLVFVKREELL